MIYRTEDLARWGVGKGVNLTPVEVDGNFWELAERLVAVEGSAGEAANGIENITVVGSQMTVYLGDGTALGPYTLPTAMIRYRGDWAAATSLNEMDLVTVPGTGLYLVLLDHTAAATFDANAVDADGNALYRFLFPLSGNTLDDLGDVDTTTTAPVAGDALVYSGTGWEPGLPAMGLSDLSGVFPGTPNDGDVLTWVAADVAWRSQPAPSGGSGAAVSDEGTQVLAAPTDINFAGAGVSVADDADGTVTVTIPGGGSTAVSDEGVQVLAGPSDLNFAGAGVTVADDGDGSVTITIPGGSAASFSDDGVQVAAAPTDVNFAGAGVSIADDGDGSVTVTVPGGGEANTIDSDPSGVTGADQITNVISLTTAEYGAIVTPDADTLYIITDAA